MKRVAFAGFAVLSLAIAAKDIHAQSAAPAAQQSFGSSLLSGITQAGRNTVDQSVTNTKSNLENHASSYTRNISDREKALTDRTNSARSNMVDKVNGYENNLSERGTALSDRANTAENDVNNKISSYKDGVNTRKKALDAAYKSKKTQLKNSENASRLFLSHG